MYGSVRRRWWLIGDVRFFGARSKSRYVVFVTDDDDRSKRPTDPLQLPPGDRVIIANQLDAIKAQGNRVEKRVDRAFARSNIAIGMSIVAMIGMIVRLILTVR